MSKVKFLWSCSSCSDKHNVFSRPKKDTTSFKLRKFCKRCSGHKIHRRVLAK